MSLSLQQRGVFYDEFGKLLKAGFPFLKAVETMLGTRSGSAMHRLLTRLRTAALEGSNITEAFSEDGMPFDEMEISLISACERSGQLVRGCQILKDYFSRLEMTRRSIWKRVAYPLFVLHFGILILAAPKLIQGVGPLVVLSGIGWVLGLFYAGAICLWLVGDALRTAARFSTAIDGLISWLPLLGTIRHSLCLGRFCTTYQMQLDAGVNVMDSLASAGRASQSAMIRKAIEIALPEIRNGGQVGPALAGTGAFPAPLIRSLVIGEQTGSLDEELTRAAAEYEEKAIHGIEAFSEWLPRLIYLAILLYLAWTIIATFKSSLSGLEKIMDTE